MIRSPRHTLTRILLLTAAAVLLMAGCRKELCYNHWEHGYNVRAQIIPEWELEWRRDYGYGGSLFSWFQSSLPAFTISPLDEEDGAAGEADDDDGWSLFDGLMPQPGAGIASVAYHESGMVTRRNIDSTGGLLHLQEGMHDILFYNNDTEYILFDALDSYAEATATTRTRTRASYNSVFKNESTVNSPDMLYGAWVEEYEGVLAPVADSLEIWLRPLVYSYLIVYHFDEGIGHIRQARGSLSGMAGKVYLQDGHTGDETVTILFDDCEIDTAHRSVVARIRSFGIPNFHYGQEVTYDRNGTEDNGTFRLGLEVLLNNGAQKEFYLDISAVMHIQPRGGILAMTGLRITDEEAEGPGGGFDVEVGGWEDPDIIELPL